jgi:hypothetical protein
MTWSDFVRRGSNFRDENAATKPNGSNANTALRRWSVKWTAAVGRP